MRKKLKKYLAYLASLNIAALNKTEKESIKKMLLIQIGFFQHERLVHLIVFVTVSVLMCISAFVFLIWQFVVSAVLFFGFLTLFIPYMIHYYFLENGVQKLYEYYDQLVNIE